MSRAFVFLAGVLLAGLAARAGAGDKLTPEQVVRAHLDEGLGPAELRSGHAREVSGVCQLSLLTAGKGVLGGSFRLTSAAPASQLLVRFGTGTYEGEVFAFDGKATEIGFALKSSSKRSALATFLAANEVIVSEGLLGGVLNASWPLLAIEQRQGKVSYEGLKKFDGRELHRLRYRAKKDQGELTIHLYFETETFRHLATVYAVSRAQGMVGDPRQSSKQSDVYYRLEERFADFKRVEGLMLPQSWVLRYETSGNTTNEWKYDFQVDSIEVK